MAPTRKYLNTKNAATQVTPFSVILAILVYAFLLGSIIWANIQVWGSIF